MSPDKKLSWSRELGVRCSECGQFLSLVDQAIIAARYTPDTPWTSERMDFYHRPCQPRVPDSAVPTEVRGE